MENPSKVRKHDPNMDLDQENALHTTPALHHQEEKAEKKIRQVTINSISAKHSAHFQL